MSAVSEFIIAGIVEGELGLTHVIGRCGDVTLRVGDVFGTLEDASGTIHSVNLEIARIAAYGHDLQELGFGMTGTLSLRGEGVKQISPSCILIGATKDSNALQTRAETSRPA
jgi:hypothetical protein